MVVEQTRVQRVNTPGTLEEDTHTHARGLASTDSERKVPLGLWWSRDSPPGFGDEQISVRRHSHESDRAPCEIDVDLILTPRGFFCSNGKLASLHLFAVQRSCIKPFTEK
ncbi:hypothetical protein J6590_035251 [Homalodisca vitripennis]|nr:hypothetical protein J6590_035251 [Homalodisca vitripennis]